MLLVNNDAGVWFTYEYEFTVKVGAVAVQTCNTRFVKLHDIEGIINFNGVTFNADRMESVGEKCD